MNSTNRQESFEKITLPNSIAITKENKEITFIKNKYRKIIIFLSLTILSLILLIWVLFFYLFNTNKKGELNDNNYNNIIKATYQTTSGEKIKLFNYNNIKNEDYKITLLESNNNKNFRNLQNIIDFEFTPNVNEIISVNIQFKKSFNNFNSLFEDITQLKKIDLTNFDMANVTNMDSMFSGCTSLEEINLSGVDTRNVKSMNYLFKDCKKLKEVDMSSINSQNIENMTSLFSGCKNISRINISSFNNVEDDFLKGVNSKVDIISNEIIYNKLNQISLNNLNKNINIIISNVNGAISNIKSKTCEIGENEKCKACSSLFKGDCLLCNEGYFLPIDSPNKRKCSSCKKTENCKKCFGSSIFILCQECEEGYILENNICKKDSHDKKPEENDCIIGTEEKCLSCKKEKGKKNECSQCNEGFYLPIDSKDKTKCETCKIDNCIACLGSLNSPICTRCKKGFKLFDNKCEEEKYCEIGENEKCRLCRTEKNRRDECLLCNNGYFIPDNALDRKKCQKCEMKDCKKCSGIVGNQKCIECENYPFYENGEIKSCNKCKIGEGEKCLSCNKDDHKCAACNEGYKLMPDGTCLLIDNSFTAIFNSTSNNSTKIMCNYHLNLQLTDFIMYVDGKIAFPTIETFPNSKLPFITYKFNSVGLHNVKVSFKKVLRNCIGWMFGWCADLIYVKFSKTFDSSHVTSIYNMFNCDYSLQWVDLSSFNTSRVTDMTDVFWSCTKITAINLSNFNTSLVRRMEGMFDHCAKLNYIDLSNFNMSIVNNTISLFSGVAKNGIIKISNLFGEYKNLIPKNWTIIIE